MLGHIDCCYIKKSRQCMQLCAANDGEGKEQTRVRAALDIQGLYFSFTPEVLGS